MPFQRKLISRSDLNGAWGAVLELKKRHVESVTRLPTERLATACWDFIVVKSTRREPAPALVFGSLQATNIEIYQQVINKCSSAPKKPFHTAVHTPKQLKTTSAGAIPRLRRINPENPNCEVKGHSQVATQKRAEVVWHGN